MMKKKISVIMVLLLCFGLFGCRDSHRYYNDDPHFWTVAISSMLGARGGDGDRIEVMEEDEYGRTMFSFKANSTLLTVVAYSIVICQRYDEKYAYYYTDYNFIVAKTAEDISEEKIELLKERNDWGKEICEEKLFKTKITRKKLGVTGKAGDEIENKLLKKVLALRTEEKIKRNDAIFLVKDEYGRHIHFIRIRDKEFKFKAAYVTIINKNGTYDKENCIMEITDILWDYQDELKAFKERNNWNQPL